MPNLLHPHFDAPTCPHCGVTRPNLSLLGLPSATVDHTGRSRFRWGNYVCSSFGLVTLVGVFGSPPGSGNSASDHDRGIQGVYPTPRAVSGDVPATARNYLDQALRSLSAPDGAVMLAASGVDALLKEKALVAGSLYSRINQARDSHLITPDMADWAHDVRLEANNSRHVDPGHAHHTTETAQQAVDFALALAEILYVLPARVGRGRAIAKELPAPGGPAEG